MTWLIIQIWALLLGAFLIGLATGWSIRRRDTTSSQVAATPGADEPILYAPPLLKPADDLSQIIGVDALTADRLNGLGVFYLSQIASWSAAHVRWVEDALGQENRIIRERWVDQASALKDG